MGVKNLSPQQLTANWQRGTSGAGQAYKDGVNGVQDNPCAKAASSASRQKYAQNTQLASQDGGAMEQGLNAVSLPYWKSQAAGVGATNLVSGATKGAPKYGAKASQLIQAYTAGSQAAANATGVSAKIMANINAMRAAFGKSPLA